MRAKRHGARHPPRRPGALRRDRRSPRRPARSASSTTLVEANEDGGEQLTYDLLRARNVTYVANGFVATGTIGLVMDCDTTGIEPDFALVKFKKLAGGGYFKIINQSCRRRCASSATRRRQIDDDRALLPGRRTP